MHLYKGEKELGSYNVGIGENKGDAQTKTVIENGRVLWDKGNKTTGAGIYTVSGVTAKNDKFSGAPSWVFKNEAGVEVPMAIHASFGGRTKKIEQNEVVYTYSGRPDSFYKKEGDTWLISNKNTNNVFTPIQDKTGSRTKELDKNAKPVENESIRLSNGCINGVCRDLKDLHNKGFGEGRKLYVLPEDHTNTFKVAGKSLQFISQDTNVNRTTSGALNTYKDVKPEIDVFKMKTLGEKEFTGGWGEKQFYTRVKPFAASLSTNKKELMSLTGVDNDTYNDIAEIAFGIFGVETNFGDQHSGVGNFSRAVKKYFDPQGASSPDYLSKYETYGGQEDNNSVGLTQIRFSMLDDSEKNVLKKIGIISNKDLLNPEKAAAATMAILIKRYQNQLNTEQKQDLQTHLPKTWNKRENYSQRVNQLKDLLVLKEMD
jgi:hypothetical protein